MPILDEFASPGGNYRRRRRHLHANCVFEQSTPFKPRRPRDMAKSADSRHYIRNRQRQDNMAMDDSTRTELEAAVFRRLVEHLRTRSDVQNIDLMNLAGFCRNCLSNWLKEAADAKGLPMSKDESREAVYGMPYEEWKAEHQSEATPEQMAAMKKVHPGH
jgi:uncharacterized protein